MDDHASSQELADFIVGLDATRLPKRAIELAVDATADCVGCTLAGSREPLADIIRRVVGTSTSGSVVMIGCPDRASPTDSALYNGALAHALDFDDITHPAYSHPSAVLVPTIISLSAHSPISGLEAMAAYVIGIEVFGKLGRALNTAHYIRGWHATSTFGSLASAAAASRLLRLSAQETRAALAIGASAASGLRANFGTMTKPLHCGYAARNGVLAAQLAREGLTACDDILGHPFGFANTFNRGSDIDWTQLRNWGNELEILSEVGLALKLYPACGAAHPAIEATLLLRKQIGSRVGEIETIRVGVPKLALQPLITATPRTSLEGKFHMGHLIATALIDGKIGLASFSPAKLSDPHIGAMRSKVCTEADDRLVDNTEFGAIVTIRLKDRTSYEELVPLAIGKPERWFSREQLRDKFLDCASHIIGVAAADHLFERLIGLASETEVGGLLAEFGGNFSSSRAQAIA